MNLFLLPDDEGELVEHISGDLGLVQVQGDGWDRGGLPRDLGTGRFGPQPWDIVWWASDIGPMRRMGDAPPSEDAKGAVALRLNQEADPAGWNDLLDTERSPIIRFRRSNWNRNECLNPGQLQAMSIPVNQQPEELMRLHRGIARWLKSGREKINPFRHTISTAAPEPERLGPLTAWARPHALAWIRAGGKVWPWSG